MSDEKSKATVRFEKIADDVVRAVRISTGETLGFFSKPKNRPFSNLYFDRGIKIPRGCLAEIEKYTQLDEQPARDELKPCPFCGDRDLSAVELAGGCWVTCEGCGAHGPGVERSKADALKLWNTRPGDAAAGPCGQEWADAILRNVTEYKQMQKQIELLTQQLADFESIRLEERDNLGRIIDEKNVEIKGLNILISTYEKCNKEQSGVISRKSAEIEQLCRDLGEKQEIIEAQHQTIIKQNEDSDLGKKVILLQNQENKILKQQLTEAGVTPDEVPAKVYEIKVSPEKAPISFDFITVQHIGGVWKIFSKETGQYLGRYEFENGNDLPTIYYEYESYIDGVKTEAEAFAKQLTRMKPATKDITAVDPPSPPKGPRIA